MRLLLLLLALLLPAQAPPPALEARWSLAGLHVTWSGAPADSCLYLTSGSLHDEWLDAVPCGPAGDVTLPTGGVDAAEAPQLREQVELRRPGATVASAAIPAPRWWAILPVVRAP